MLKKMRNLQLRKDKKNQKGFTLVELMATLGILALIVAIAVPAIGGIMDKASDSANQADEDMVVKAASIMHANEYEGSTDTGSVKYTVTELTGAGYLESNDRLSDDDYAVKSSNSSIFEFKSGS